jgi:hypothetical protein
MPLKKEKGAGPLPAPVLEVDVKWEEISQLASASLLPKLPHPPDSEDGREEEELGELHLWPLCHYIIWVMSYV